MRPKLRSAPPRVIAHRGASGTRPENTLSSVETALEMCAEMIEIDVRTTLDGELVIMHDADVGRTTNGEGLVSGMELGEIHRLDAGVWFGGAFRGERIPLLGEVLDAVRERATLCIEVKDARPSQVLDEVARRDMLQDVILFDFNHPRLYEAKLLRPGAMALALGVTGESVGDVRTDLVDAIGVNYSKTGESLVRRAHELGVAVFVYTVDDPEKMTWLVENGVDAIITNHPEIALELLGQMP